MISNVLKKLKGVFCSTHFSSYLLDANGKDISDVANMVVKRKLETPSFNFLNLPTTIADAFVFANNESIWLFYELQEHLDSKGLIMSIHSEDGIVWSNPELVLEERVHLSFPFVFFSNKATYMLPETSFMNEIRLYKGSNDCRDFKYLKTILKGERYVDSVIYEKDGYLYLFTSIQNNDNSYILKIFLSSDLEGEWIEHPKSPISSGKYCERNAGSIINYKGILLRPAQNNTLHYATNTHLFKITNLSPTEYSEEPYALDILPSGFLQNVGGHQLSYVKFKDNEYVAIDVLQTSINLNAIIKRIKYILRK